MKNLLLLILLVTLGFAQEQSKQDTTSTNGRFIIANLGGGLAFWNFDQANCSECHGDIWANQTAFKIGFGFKEHWLINIGVIYNNDNSLEIDESHTLFPIGLNYLDKLYSFSQNGSLIYSLGASFNYGEEKVEPDDFIPIGWMFGGGVNASFGVRWHIITAETYGRVDYVYDDDFIYSLGLRLGIWID